MTKAEMIAWLEREKAETLLECRKERFQQAIDRLKIICLRDESIFEAEGD